MWFSQLIQLEIRSEDAASFILSPSPFSTSKTALMVRSFAKLQHEHPGPTNSNPNSGQLKDFSRTQINVVPSIKHINDKQDKSITSQWELELYPHVDSMVSDLAGHILHSYPCPHAISTVTYIPSILHNLSVLPNLHICNTSPDIFLCAYKSNQRRVYIVALLFLCVSACIPRWSILPGEYTSSVIVPEPSHCLAQGTQNKTQISLPTAKLRC